MAAPKITLRKAADLRADPRNARTHSEAQVAAIAASLLQFGFTNPVLVDGEDKLDIAAGHGRVLGALQVYADGGTLRFPNGDALPAGTVPTLDVTGWSSEQRRAYVLADNQLALLAGWDETLLGEELAALAASDFDMPVIGFDQAALHALLNNGSGATDPDDAPPVPESPVSQLGDIWIMGDHRIICGSSTDPDDVAAVLDGAKPHLMVTDPPYGVEYDAAWRNGIRREDGSIVGARATGKVLNDDRVDWTDAWKLFPGDVLYVWGPPGENHAEQMMTIQSAGFDIRMGIVWAKSQLVIGRGNYHPQHEHCWYAVRKGRNGHWQGSRKETTLWSIDKPRTSETGHSTQKPVDCMKRPIENNSEIGDAIYEPFSGSGTTIIAAQVTGRRCYAVELNPAYVDVSVKRWQEYVGVDAILASTGQTFSEVNAERLASA